MKCNFKLVFCLLLSVATFNVLAMGEDPPPPSEPVEQPTSGYGSDGSYSKSSASFSNPVKSNQTVYVYWPSGATPAPTIFFSHAYGARDPNDAYGNLIDHLVSRGFAVVYPQYPNLFSDWMERYNILWTGFTEAVARYPNRLATDKVGYIGHSFGGGATPRMALNGDAQGWGSNGKFMVTMAPWYSYDMTDSDLASFSSDMKFLSFVYEDDPTNDHRMAIDIYDHISIANSERDFIKLYSDTNCSYTLEADHIPPITGGGNGVTDGYDYYGTWKFIDALAAYAHNGSLIGKNVALGNGSNAQKNMGDWTCDGTDVRDAEVTDNPSTSIPQSNYQYPWNNSKNPRN